jgi:hypothetical protein
VFLKDNPDLARDIETKILAKLGVGESAAVEDGAAETA